MSADIHDLNRHINSYLKEYLGYDAPGYAVLINAKWGAGKTHFINKYREAKLPSPGDEYVYLSLNGLKSVQEIYDCLLAEMLPAIDRKSLLLLEGF